MSEGGLRDRLALPIAGVALIAVLLAAGLEGGYERRYGALAYGVGALAAVLMLAQGPLPTLPRSVRAIGAVAAGLAVMQWIPLPPVIRGLLAPGQTARLHAVGGELAVSRDAWLAELTRLDISALLGAPEPYTFDVLAGSTDTAWRALLLSNSGWAWQAGQWLLLAAFVAVGWRIAREPSATRLFVLGILAVAILEALFGFANRNGPSTGIGTKVAYLGSATGTFINRGHFAAFLNLGLGVLWGLAASLFPLLSAEVRKHRARKRRSSQPPSVLEGSGDKIPRLILITFASAVLFVGMVAANSRGPLVGLLVASVGVGLWTRYRRDDAVHLGVALVAPLAGLVLAVVSLGPRGALGRFLTLGSGDASLRARGELWLASFQAWLDSPLVGHGAGGWRLALMPHELGVHDFGLLHAHNAAVELLVEGGVVGLALAASLAFVTGRAVLRRLDLVDHDLESSLAVGLTVSLLAILLQSGADFPLRTPGVAVPASLCLGLVLGLLGIGEAGGKRAPLAALLVLVSLTVGAAGWRDLTMEGSRAQRLGEAAPMLSLQGATDLAGQAAEQQAACEEVEAYDAWAHMACAVAASRHARAAASASDALVADVALARARLLSPRNPRLSINSARVLARLGEPTVLPNAFRERALLALIDAVAADGWRAEEGFEIANGLGEGAIDRLGAAASSESVSRSRTLYQYGLALEGLGRTEDALAAAVGAATADPGFGPPAFRAGLLAAKLGDAAAAERWYRAFLASRDRPVAMEGWVLLKLGERDAAEVRFRRAVAVDPKNRWAWEGVAAVARARENRSAEVDALERVLAITPDHAPAQSRLAELKGGGR